MVGTTLVEIREHVESLASHDGPYTVQCGRTGERPIPVAGKRFESRTLAERAASAAEQYRAALRRYDPQVPFYDLIVCQAAETYSLPSSNAHPSDSRERHRTVDTADETGPQTSNSPLVEFCHRVAAAVFETLCESGYKDVETAVMDVYFELAESVHSADEFCLCLVESMAAELNRRLSPSEQVDIITEAATRLPPVDGARGPVSETLELLRMCGLLSAYTTSVPRIDRGEGTRTVVVELSEYALSPRDGRLPVFPLALGIYRHGPDWSLSSLRVVDDGESWKVTLVQSRHNKPSDLLSVAIDTET